MEGTPDTSAKAPPRAVDSVVGQALTGVVWLVRSVVSALVTAFADPPPPRSRPLRRLVIAADVVVAVAVYAMLVSSATGFDLYAPQLLHLVGLASALPLLVRDRWPLTAWRSSWLVLIWGSFVLRDLFPFPLMAAGIAAFLLCLYSVASRCEREVTVGAWVVSLLTVTPLASDLWGVPALDPSGMLAIPVLVTIPVLFGYNVRMRRRAQRELAEQERRSEHERAARALLEERSRIARELHDVVAHHMSVIAIQAEAAPLEVPDTPELLKNRFAEIRATSLTALSEMRRILGILRGRNDQRDTSPPPGLDRLDDLAANAYAGGLIVTTSVSGRPVPLPPGVSLSGYRIVQEALSNVMRHAPGSVVEIAIGYQERPPAVRLRVENGPAPNDAAVRERPGTRHGLVGMRERAAMLRGELSAGPTPDGGFAVVATLPLDDQ